jgi:hypothetical protein
MSTGNTTHSGESAAAAKACIERTQELFRNNFTYLVDSHCPNALQAINAAAILTVAVLIDLNRIQRLGENRHE